MEQQELLHQENSENQNAEVNSGASVEEATVITSSETSAPAEETETTAPAEETAEACEPATEAPAQEEPAAVEEPAAEAPAQEEPAMVEEPAQAEPVAEEPAQAEPVAEEPAPVEETMEQVESEYANLDLEQSVAEMERLVEEPNFNLIKTRMSVLRAKIIEFLRERKRAAEAAYAEALKNAQNATEENPDTAAEAEAPATEPDQLEVRFNNAMQKYKDSKAKFIAALEAQKVKNLEAKNQILESLKNLIETESHLKTLNDKFKELQEQWKSIGPVPQTESSTLWQNYHFYVEKFFDILRINKEMRTLDLKKNLESKVELCEKAESLLLNDSINQSFRDLQALHEQWKEIGPVPEEKKEEIWERFKAASDQINQRRKDYYDKLFAEEQNNYNAKVVLCEQAEEIVAKNTESVKDYNEVSDKLTELLNMWKTLGPAPAKLNDEIWNRFKSTLDKFFGQKKEYFQQIKDSQMQNYNQKLNLAIQAEGIADRTDWKEATNDILKLQTEWKSIGATPRKYSDQIWKRFRAACDKFFEAKANYFNNIQDIEAENLKKKEELIQKILTHEFSDDRNANMEVIKQYQNEWLEIGFVPKKEKDRIYTEYRAALDQRFAELKISASDLKNNRFRNKIDNILNNPNADRIIDKEKSFLKNKLQKLKEDIILWENNLGFFSNSKNAEIITAEFRKKIESAKEEIKDLEYKIRMMDAPKKETATDESGEAPAAETAQTEE
ncbi:MAG: DUF349 domain-containing protein [Bacteroidales bacterium]|nr:DUF349 domain-containing protein [Bacteroidales bacterium]